MKAEAAPRQPGNMRPDALSGAFPILRVCPCGCARAFHPTRSWQVFFEPSCRKRVNRLAHRTGVYFDLRAELKRIESDIAEIKNFLGIKP